MIGKNTAAFLISLFQSGGLTLLWIVTDRYREKQTKIINYIGYFLLLLVIGFITFSYYLGAEEYDKPKSIMTLAGLIQYDASLMSWSKANENIENNAEIFDSQYAALESTRENGSINKPFITTIAGLIYFDASLNEWVEWNPDFIKNYKNLKTTHDQSTASEIDQKIQYHYKEASGAFKKASELCASFLPEEKRKIAYALISAAVQASIGMHYGGYPGLIASLILNLTEYGIFACEQCYQIKESLDHSEYHYQMWVYYLHKKEQ